MSGIIRDRFGIDVVDRAGQQVHDRFVEGTGALVAQSASVSGVGLVTAASTGALVAQSAHVSGVGVSASVGFGACVSQTASVSGIGEVAWLGEIISTGRATSGELIVRYTSPEYYRLQRQGYQVTRFVSPTAVHMQRM